MTTNEHFVIVGAGHAGGAAVQSLRGFGHEGPITLIGEEPSLPYERPPLSKELLQTPGGEGFRLMRDQDYYDEMDVNLHLNNAATTIDADARTITLADGATVSYDKLLLTTGGQVRTLDVPGSDLAGIHVLRTIEDSRAIEAALATGGKVAVVGGGFIGLEVAASARARGSEVTVIEAMPQLMGRSLPDDISAMFLDLHRANGVEVKLGDGVTSFVGTDKVSGVETAAGETIDGDAVVVGIGISPETSLAESAGLEIDNGIVVDEFARTSDPNIFAAGDNTNHFNPRLGRRIRLEAWLNAQDQALAAARSMRGDLKPYDKVPWMWTDQFDVNLQMAGMPTEWGELVYRGDLGDRDCCAFQLKDGKVEAALTINRPRDMRVARRMISSDAVFSEAELADDDLSLRKILKAAKSQE
ncbi:MAG: pyridine nucleotide-disulfide oxidoreductase [Rhodospirillaceae bacterium]|nr:pyridine nucleotide-disulfide oxidoreductase [Rhodospirillaceae bacterium]HAA92108.1 pyridine nucleotide-disulfide oxidoreductase [Rhodospirillaceae bacterium]